MWLIKVESKFGGRCSNRRIKILSTQYDTVKLQANKGIKIGMPPQKIKVMAKEFKIVANRNGNSNSPPSYKLFMSPWVGAMARLTNPQQHFCLTQHRSTGAKMQLMTIGGP